MGKKLRSVSFMLAILVVVCFVFSSGTFASEDAPKYKFVLVAHSTGVAFWTPVRKGAEDAAKQLGVEVQFTGPLDFNISEQRAILEAVIASNPSGIGVTLPDATAFDDLVTEALEKGIPVVCFNTDDDTPNDRMCYIGQDNTEAGRVWARQIAKILGGKGKVALLIESPGQISLEQRLKGAREILDQTDIKYTILNTTTDRVKALGVIESYYMANPDANGFFSVDTTGTPAAAEFIKREGLKGKVFSGGFDLTPETLQAIKDGYCEFTIDQQPYLQGYYSVVQLYLYKKFGLHPCDINTGAAVIDRSNVDLVIDLAEKGYR